MQKCNSFNFAHFPEMKVKSDAIIDRFTSSAVYVYFSENLEQCSTYDLIIRPFVNVSLELDINDEKRIFKHSFLLFNEPQPPKNFHISNDDSEKNSWLELQWEHLECYDSYYLTVQIDKNATFLLNESLIEAKHAWGKISYRMENLQHCTAYTFLLR